MEGRVYGGSQCAPCPDLLNRSSCKEMEQDSSEEAMTEFKERTLGGWGLLQITAGTGLAVYTVWAGIIMPGFRRVPLKLQVPYVPASHAQVRSVMTLLQGRSGNIADLGSGDGRIVLEAYRQGFQPVVGYELNPWLIRLSNFHAWRAGYSGKVSFRQEDLWKVSLAECRNVTVFLAPSVLPLLQEKLLLELPLDALVVAGRFPFPGWAPCRTEGVGVHRAWAYNIQALRQAARNQDQGTPV
ncbi:adenine nucleotide translocase lysine N-methyltransferase [Acipenser oxyrinchus oxyrinchus]|uniref:Adenine nucleotide translocase lysine N-methyltransferase n=1 Tax=Acipenser oxyrinchus oxyrinchus TaxID=40147 RepID=A0AAD8FZ98_ACIOX|nr:adenine nucleotide translocase lysine N-methyltransferase [Acipenser oxyrinchus oxyrinchus]